MFFAAPTKGIAFNPVSAAPPKNPFRLIVAPTVASAIAVPIQGTERPSRREIRMPPHRAIRCPMFMAGF
jgi:hypothetical protein